MNLQNRQFAYPIFVNLTEESALVVGAGRVGERKVRGLLRCGARVTVVAPLATRAIRKLATARKLRWHAREFQPADLRAQRLVFCATDHLDVDLRVARAARRRGALVNCASSLTPALGNFILPATARTGMVQVAVSTGGASPALARKLLRRIVGGLGAQAARWARLLQQMRPLVVARVPAARRSALWKHLVADDLGELLRAGKLSAARKLALQRMDAAAPRKRVTANWKDIRKAGGKPVIAQFEF